LKKPLSHDFISGNSIFNYFNFTILLQEEGVRKNVNWVVWISIAGLMAISLGCTTPGEKTGIGAGVGAAAGAGLGAIIGNQSGHPGQGALLGAVAGGLIGGAVGNRLDKQAKELAAVAETKRTDHGVLTKLKGDILFDTGKADLKSAATDNISKIGDIIKKYPEDRIIVVGFTDNTGSSTVNKTLSEERANAVKIQLVSAGVPPETVTAMGWVMLSQWEIINSHRPRTEQKSRIANHRR